MSIPLPVMMAAVNAMQSAARSRQMNSAQQSALALEREKLRREALYVAAQQETARRSLELARIDAEMEDRQRERQKEVLLQLLDTADNIHRRDVDAIMEVFRSASGLIQSHMNALSEEKSALTTALVSGEISPARHVLIMKRQRDLDREMNQVEEWMADLSRNAVQTIRSLQPKLQVQAVESMVRQQIGRPA